MLESEKYDLVIDRLAVLAEPMRTRILLEIAANKELRGKDILERFSVTQPTMSHHMNILTENGLVDIRKEGRCVWYSINAATFAEIKEVVLAISDNKSVRKSSAPISKPILKKAPVRAKTSSVTSKVKTTDLKKDSSVPKPKQAIEVPDIKELKKNKKKKKEKDKDNKSDKKKKDKKKKK